MNHFGEGGGGANDDGSGGDDGGGHGGAKIVAVPTSTIHMELSARAPGPIASSSEVYSAFQHVPACSGNALPEQELAGAQRWSNDRGWEEDRDRKGIENR